MLHSIMLPFCLRSSGRPGTEAAAKARQLITATDCSSLRRAPSSGWGLDRGCGEGRGVGGGEAWHPAAPWRSNAVSAGRSPGLYWGQGQRWRKGRRAAPAADVSFSKILHLGLCQGLEFNGECTGSIPYFLLNPEPLPGGGGSVGACRASPSKRNVAPGAGNPASPVTDGHISSCP